MPGLLFAALLGCGSSFEIALDFDPDSTTTIADYLAPLDIDFQDYFYVEGKLEEQPMIGVLAATFPDACAAYSSYVPVADENYQAMLDLSGGEAEEAVQQAWQETLLQTFPIGSTILFLAFGVDELSTEAVETTYAQTWDIGSATLGDTQGPQPAGTFVADVFVVAEGIDVYCLYSGLCEDADQDAANQALYNQWSADAGTASIETYGSGGKLEGQVDMTLVSRWVDTQIGVPAPLGDASATFSLKPCESVDERIFRYWTPL